MVRIVEIIQLCVLPVDGQRVLGQIVSADAEEIHFLRQKVADHHRGGRLDHDALLEITVRNPGPVHLLLDLLHHGLDAAHLVHGNDHRVHDRQVPVGAGPQDGAKLRFEDLRPGKADADGPKAHGRIVLLAQVEIGHLLVGSDVQRADDDLLSSHGLRYRLVGLKLLVLGGVVALFQIKELAPEQSDAAGVVGQRPRGVADASDVGVELDLPPAQGHIFLALELREELSLLFLLLKLLPVSRQRGLVRIHIKDPLFAVDNRHLSAHLRLYRHADERRDIHGAGQDGRV